MTTPGTTCARPRARHSARRADAQDRRAVMPVPVGSLANGIAERRIVDDVLDLMAEAIWLEIRGQQPGDGQDLRGNPP